MKVKTDEMTARQLDWAVASIEGYWYFPKSEMDGGAAYVHKTTGEWYHWGGYCPTTNWAQGGPIIEREGMRLCVGSDGEWDAELCEFNVLEQGPTPLIAAMRCYVASKLGDTVDIPEGLL